MVDNEQLEVRGGDDVKEDTSICRSCSDCACTRLLQLGTTVNAAASDCSENDSVINAAYDKSTTEPFVDASDNLRHIVIDGSNIAMRFAIFYTKTICLRGLCLHFMTILLIYYNTTM